MYFTALKHLLGVRRCTPNDLCLVELWLPGIEAGVKDSQHKFWLTMVREQEGMTGNPFWFVCSLVKTEKAHSARYVSAMLESDHIFSSQALSEFHNRVKLSSSTRMVTYCEIIPDIEVFPLYCSRKEIKEFYRVTVTRIRLSSHRFDIETGRWSRLPRAERK